MRRVDPVLAGRMTISDRDRKLLWARAHARCSSCKLKLTIDATATDSYSIVGEEAHIVARSESGPRGGRLRASELDT